MAVFHAGVKKEEEKVNACQREWFIRLKFCGDENFDNWNFKETCLKTYSRAECLGDKKTTGKNISKLRKKQSKIANTLTFGNAIL